MAGKAVDVPVYDFKTHTRYGNVSLSLVLKRIPFRSKTDRKLIRPSEVVLVEGILILYDPEIREMLQMKLFVDTDSDTRLARRGGDYTLLWQPML